MKTEATQRGSRSGKQRSQADRATHAAIFRESRLRAKRKREELEQEIPMLKSEILEMKKDFEDYTSKTEVELQQLRRTIVEQKKVQDVHEIVGFGLCGETNFQASMKAQQMGYGVPTTYVAGSSLWAKLPSENHVLFTQGHPGVPTTYATGSSLWAHLPLENDEGHPAL